MAQDLATFLATLQRADSTGGPLAGVHSFHRGAPPAHYDDETRQALVAVAKRHDRDGMSAVWDAALAARWTGEPVWFHGDVASDNMLLDNAGQLIAMIDFGTCGVGDPACDLVIAWTLFEGAARAAFRARIPADEGMWARARGWALWKALITLAAPTCTPDAAAQSHRIVEAVVAEHGADTGHADPGPC